MLLNLRIYRLLGVYCVHLMVIGSTLSLLACTDSRRLDYALEFAGNNRGELEKVLDYYKNDSQQLAAARFLIENMPQCYFRYFRVYKKVVPDEEGLLYNY